MNIKIHTPQFKKKLKSFVCATFLAIKIIFYSETFKIIMLLFFSIF